MKFATHRNVFRALAALAVVALLAAAPPAARADAGDLRATYDIYLSASAKYKEAIASGADAGVIETLAAQFEQAKRDYDAAKGDPGATTPLAAPTVAEPVAADGATTPAAAASTATDTTATRIAATTRSATGLDKIATLERQVAAAGNSPKAAELKLQLGETLGRYTGDWARAKALADEVIASGADAATLRKAGQLSKQAAFETVRLALAAKIGKTKTAAITAYTAYKATSWLSPFKKIKTLGTYWSTTFKYRQAVADYADAKKVDEADQQARAKAEATLDNLTDSTVIPGNAATLLQNGKCAFERRHDLARDAQSYIYVQYLSYKCDETGNRLADALIARAKAGVDVRVIIDYWTTFDYGKEIVYKLRAGGVKVALFNNPYLKPLRVNNRFHQKLFIVDDLYAITGGMNVGDDYAKGSIAMEGWRDTDVMLEGPVVMDMKRVFLDNWTVADNESVFPKDAETLRQETEDKLVDFKVDDSSMYKVGTNEYLVKEVLEQYWSVPPRVEGIDVRFIAHYPLNKDDQILEALVWYIDRAKTQIVLETPYFLPSERLSNALVGAAKRGVKVRVITNSMYSNDMGKYIVYASHYFFQDLMEKGIEIREWYGCQTLHSKVNYLDNDVVTIGSYNLNSRSHTLDAEELVLIENPAFAATVHEMLERDLKYTRVVTIAEAKAWRSTFTGKMQLTLFHLVDGMF